MTRLVSVSLVTAWIVFLFWSCRDPIVPPDLYAADTLVVRRILDDNNLNDVSVSAIIYASDQRRLTWLCFDPARMGGRKITTLTASIGSLGGLEILDIKDNALTALPPEIGKLTKMNFLNVQRNALAALPPEIGQCTGLAMLYLRRNGLTALPAGLGSLKKLSVLDVDSNAIAAVPSEITGCDSLATLLIQANELASLPGGMIHMGGLGVLKIEYNRIHADSIPDSLKTWLDRIAGNWQATQRP